MEWDTERGEKKSKRWEEGEGEEWRGNNEFIVGGLMPLGMSLTENLRVLLQLAFRDGRSSGRPVSSVKALKEDRCMDSQIILQP